MKKRIVLFLTALIALVLPCFAKVALTASANSTNDYHTVTFMLDETIVYDEIEVQNNAYASLPETPTKDGSVFECWLYNDEPFSFKTRITQDVTLVAKWDELLKLYNVEFKVNGETVNTQKVEENGDAIAPTSVVCPVGKDFDGWDGDYTNVTADTIVNAILVDKEYTVTLYGLDDVVLETLTVVHGENATLPNASDFALAHYTVDGYLNQAEAESVTENVDIYVNYIPDEYDITFYVNGETFETQSIKYGETVAFPSTTPNVENYIFIGWYKDLDNTAMFNFYTVIESDLELYAKFIPIQKPKYEVRFFDADGNQYGGTQWVEEGQSAVIPGDPYKAGYEFLGWAQDFTNITENLDVYPTYAIKSYTVTFEDETGVIKTERVKYGANATAPATSEIRIPVGKEFAGWEGSYKNITGDTSITAKFRAQTFVVMFYNGSKRVGAIQYIEYGQDAKAPVLADKEGYTFLGWSDGETVSDDVYKNITEDCVFFAEYEQITYTVTFYEGNKIVKTETVNHGDRLDIYLYNKAGYIFVGWYTDESFANAYDFSLTVTDDFAVYANWEEKPAITHTVTFFVDGAVYGSEQIVADGASAIAPATPQKAGYTFVGWDTAFNEVTSDLEIHAEFEINVYTVTFEYNGKEMSVQVVYLQSASAPGDVEKEGYTFKGWDKTFDQVTDDITVKAIYDINKYTVKFFNGFTLVSEQVVEHNQYASIVSTPKKGGYKFVGWYYLETVDGVENEIAFSFSMPITKNMGVSAKFTPFTYDVLYYIDGELYDTQTLEVDSLIVPLGEPIYDDEDIIFSGWSFIPQYMPAQNVIVTATTYKLQTFTLSYYVDNELYASFEIKEGSPLTQLDAPTDLPDDIVFVRWGKLPETMPRGNLDVYATIMKYYSVNYYVNGELYTTQKVLQGNAIPEMDAPTDLPEWIVFIRWGDAPSVMPQRTVKIYAEIKILESYNVRYYVNGVLYHEELVLEGSVLTPISEPTLESNQIFSGWNNLPESLIMPAYDLRIDGFVTQKELRDNRFVVCVEDNGNGEMNVTISVSEKVNVAGIIANVYYGDAECVGATESDSTFAYDNGEYVRFIWSNGYNTTEETTLIEMTFSINEKYDASAIEMIIEQIYVLTDNGETVPADYVIEYER